MHLLKPLTLVALPLVLGAPTIMEDEVVQAYGDPFCVVPMLQVSKSGECFGIAASSIDIPHGVECDFFNRGTCEPTELDKGRITTAGCHSLVPGLTNGVRCYPKQEE